MLKVGLIGLGGMGNSHANCYAELSDKVTLAAVADVDLEKSKNIAKRFGSEIYANGEELIEKADVDIIDICLPTYLHTKHAVLAMEKGAHIFMEKPVCLNMEEAELLLKTQEKTGAKMQIGQVIRFWDEYVWLKEAVDKGTYGKVISGVFNRISPHPKWSWENWFNNPELSGSMATDLHVHDVDYIRYLMGEPDEVFSRATRDKDGVLQQIFTIYQYPDSIITSEGCWDYPDDFPFQMNFRVKLEKATVTLEKGEFTVYPLEGGKFSPDFSQEVVQNEDTGTNISSLGAFYNEIKYFIECIEKDLPIEIAPLSEAVKSLELNLKEINMAGGLRK